MLSKDSNNDTWRITLLLSGKLTVMTYSCVHQIFLSVALQWLLQSIP